MEADGNFRCSAEAGRLDKGPQPGQFYMCGDATCCMELIDANKMINGAKRPWSADGSGYVVWANSNGDWFMDKNTYAETGDPQQLWACISFEPRDFNNMRSSPSPADENGFMVAWLEFASTYSTGAVTQDGTGIDFWKFADDSFDPAGSSVQKRGNGWALGAGTMYDGLYTHKPMLASPAWSDASYRATCWFAYDSDGGVITYSPVAVEELPSAILLSQNTPNPFNPSTSISFTLLEAAQVTLDIFNIAGQKVSTLIDGTLTAGSHSVTWDGAGFPAGVYFYTLSADGFTRTMKMTLVK
jgi:hypothetical protein